MDAEQLAPVSWVVVEPDPQRKLFWFCSDVFGAPWVEVMATERLLNDDETMAAVRRTVCDRCGPEGEILFAGDSTLYRLGRVELRAGACAQTLVFDPDLVALDQHILIRLFTLPAAPNSAVPAKISERRVQRGWTLKHAIRYAERIALLAAENGGLIAFAKDPDMHFLDRIEVYYDGQFEKLIPLDYSGLNLPPD